MPPESLPPWDRKDLRKHERWSDPVGSGSSRWRLHNNYHHHNHHHGSSSSFRSRPPGHVRQGGWHPYSDDGFTPSRSNDKIVDDEGFRQFGGGYRADGKYNRNSRENKGTYGQKDYPWENGASPNGQRSVDMLTYNSHHPHSNYVNTWDQLHFKNHHDKIGSVNGLGTGQRSERENSNMGLVDWKPLKWNRSGSLPSQGSKSIGVDSSEAKPDVEIRNVTPVQSPSGGDAVDCATSTGREEETCSRKKKPRLGWGEGLAKYEKKKVEGPDDSATKCGMVAYDNREALNSHVSNLSDKSPIVAAFSDCASPASPSSVSCSFSPGVEDKPLVKTVDIDNATSNLSGSPSLLSQNHVEGLDFNLENLELVPIGNLSSSLGELPQSADHFSVDSGFVRSTAMNKLLVWKGDISKELEVTESEIDLLENELKSLISESGNSCPCRAGSSSLQGEYQAKPCEELVASNVIPRLSPLQPVSSEDMIVEKPVGSLDEEHGQVKCEDINFPGTARSNSVEPLSTEKITASGDLDTSKSSEQEVKCSVRDSNEDNEDGLAASEGGQWTAGKSCVTPGREDILYDLILVSNKDSANRASEVFNKLLPSDQCHSDVLRTINVSSWQNDPLIKEKFATRKRLLKFKERAITLKFRAFQHLWKEDMHSISIRKYRAKPSKRLELSSRAAHSGYLKNQSPVHSRFSPPAGNLSLLPTTEVINLTSKLLSDSQVKLCRNFLKMPALILDKKEKMISRFITSNGLVEDPCAIEKERAIINPWTTEEKEIFMEKLATLGKEFRKIASFLDHKTTADCVEFYYKNHKSDYFLKTKKKPEFAKQGKPLSTTTYLVTSGKRWNRETNAASLDMLGAASAAAANAYDDMKNQQKFAARFSMRTTTEYRAPRGDDAILARSGSLDKFNNDRERETVAADVLAGICGSLSSEAMSSCITSSFDPGESYQERKCQKVGSLTRQPLTPEVTQNVDDETFSDESCGEMDRIDWTDEEKSILIQAVSSYGKNFTMISRCVRTRSRDQCKVFFSKARKCLGLDMIRPGPGNEGMPASDDANGGGSDNEDACVMGADSVICNEKSGSKVDEDLILADLNENHCKSDPAERMNIESDLTKSDENNNGTENINRIDPELESENEVTDDWPAEGKQELDCNIVGKIENGVGADSMLVTVQFHKEAVLPPDNVAGGDGSTREGTSLEDPLSGEEANNDRGLSVLGAEGETTVVGPELASEDELKDKLEENVNGITSVPPSDFNSSDQCLHTTGNVSDLAADTKGFVEEFDFDPKQEQNIALQLNPPPEPCVNSLEQDVSVLNASSITEGPPSSQREKDLSDTQCQTSTSAADSNQYQLGHVLGRDGSCQILGGYPLQLSIKKETNGDIGSEKLSSFQSLSKEDGNFHSDIYLSQDCFLKKCNGAKARSLVTQLPSHSQELKSDQSRPHSRSSSDTEKPCRNGDVKLFGKILTHPSSQQKQTSGHEDEDEAVEDEAVQHLKLSSKNFNLKFTESVDGNSVSAKLDRNNYPGLENVPMSFGFWDGNRIFPSLPDSAIVLAKYPAPFGNYSTSSSNSMEQQPFHSVVKSSERNLNGVSVFSNRETSSSNGTTDYQLYRNPFTVDMKQRQDMLFSDMQRRKGLEAVSSIQQQARGMVGINVVGRGGILVGGAGSGVVSDPVAAIKMHYAKTEQFGGHYAKTEQFGGQPVSVVGEEESWRGEVDVGRS